MGYMRQVRRSSNSHGLNERYCWSRHDQGDISGGYKTVPKNIRAAASVEYWGLQGQVNWISLVQIIYIFKNSIFICSLWYFYKCKLSSVTCCGILSCPWLFRLPTSLCDRSRFSVRLCYSVKKEKELLYTIPKPHLALIIYLKSPSA